MRLKVFWLTIFQTRWKTSNMPKSFATEKSFLGSFTSSYVGTQAGHQDGIALNFNYRITELFSPNYYFWFWQDTVFIAVCLSFETGLSLSG
jgi:hypothetical protein